MMMKTQSKKAQSEFEKNKYIVFSNALNPQTLNFIYSYIKIFADRLEASVKHLPEYYTKEEHGFIEQGEIGYNSMSKYGDMMADTLLLVMREGVESMIGLELVPTYGYFRLYKNGNDLKPHKDRAACEISLSLCIGYEGEQWPIYIDGIPIYQKPGEVVVYRGCDVEHWREPFKGINQAQIFLHYTDKNGPYGEQYTYDGRPFVGLPTGDQEHVYKGTRFFNKEKFSPQIDPIIEKMLNENTK